VIALSLALFLTVGTAVAADEDALRARLDGVRDVLYTQPTATSLEQVQAIHDEARAIADDHPIVGSTLGWMALLEAIMGNASRAVVHADAYLEVADSEDAQDIRVQVGALLIKAGHPDAAIPYLRAAREAVEEAGGTPAELCERLNWEGRAHWEAGDLAAAEAIFARSLSIAEAGAPELIGTALGQASVVLRARGRHQEARAAAERRLQILVDEGEPPGARLSVAHMNLGLTMQDLGDLEAAKDALEHALAVLDAMPEPPLRTRAAAMRNLSNLLAEMGDTEQVVTQAEAIVSLFEDAHGPTHPLVGRALSDLGLARIEILDVEGAREALFRARAIFDARYGPHHPQQVDLLQNIAAWHRTAGEIGRAIEVQERVLEVRRATLRAEHDEVVQSMVVLAVFHRISGEPLRCRKLLEEALALLHANPESDSTLEARALNRLGSLLWSLGDGDGALVRLSQAEAVLAGGSQSAAHGIATLLTMSDIHRDSGRLDDAEDVLEQAQQRFEASLPPGHSISLGIRRRLGRVYDAQGRRDEARSLYRALLAAMEASLGPSHPDLLSTLGLLADLEEGAAQRALLARALDIAEAAYGDAHPKTLTALNQLAAHVRSSDSERARAMSTRAYEAWIILSQLVRGLSEREAMAYTQRADDTLHDWLQMHNRPADDQRAWAAVVRYKARIARHARARSAAARLSPEGREAWEALGRIRHALAEVALGESVSAAERAGKLRALGERAEALERQQAVATPEEVDPQAVCEALDDRTALVDILRTEVSDAWRYEAFIVRDCETIARVVLGEATTIDDAVAHWNGLLARASPTLRVDAAGEKVRQLVWDPLVPHLDGAEALVLVPDGELATVSLAALPMEDGSYLIEHIIPTYLDNAGDLVPASTPLGTGALVVGGVDFGHSLAPLPCSDSFAALSGAEREAEAVTRRLRRYGVTALGGSAATEAAVAEAATGKRHIHIATHGFFASEDCRGSSEEGAFHPMALSGVALAGANVPGTALSGGGDGVWTALEVSTLDLRGTELVVLSACGTGLGEVRAGEGVLGLRRAFSAAGARHQLLSLWPVGDDSTRDLMEDAYRFLRRSPVADALHKAQLEALERNRERHGDARPWDWGAFIATGPHGD